jgi:ATP-dependent RNA helicase DDX23/PRP28
MKVKFISKKEREQLKAERDNSIPPSHHSTNHTENPQESTRQPNSHQETPHPKPSQQQEEKVNFSEHFMGVEREEADVEPRERSRDAKYQELTRDELEERSKMKNRMLGLTKAEISQRRHVQYRNQLLFEWDKGEDTSQGFVPILKPEVKPKDIIESESREGWKTKPFERMEERDWRIFREDHEIYIRGGKAPSPIREWSEM